MPIVTLTCSFPDQHSTCTSKLCECDCHNTTPAKVKLAEARERAHAAVKHFDWQPDLARTQAAIEALTQYEQHLKEQQ